MIDTPLMPLDDALAVIGKHMTRVNTTTQTLREARGRILGADITATEPLPPFDSSAMDGYAIRSSDLIGATVNTPVELSIIDESAAGRPATSAVEPLTAIRIMTGAVIPDGANAVVRVEHVIERQDQILITEHIPTGRDIRPRGDAMAPGESIAHEGTQLTPHVLALIAASGRATVTATRQLRIGVLSSGDELVEPGATLNHGQIFDSNRIMLQTLIEATGAHVIDLGSLSDSSAETEAEFQRIANQTPSLDLVVATGGVSVGDYDHVRTVLDRLGCLEIHRVAVRPAKPLAFGTLQRTPFFGLAGNPVSAAIGFELFVRPALAMLAGHANEMSHPWRTAQIGADLERTVDGKVHVVTGGVLQRADGCLEVSALAVQGSHQLGAFSRATALIRLDDGHGVAKGDQVQVLPLPTA